VQASSAVIEIFKIYRLQFNPLFHIFCKMIGQSAIKMLYLFAICCHASASQSARLAPAFSTSDAPKYGKGLVLEDTCADCTSVYYCCPASTYPCCRSPIAQGTCCSDGCYQSVNAVCCGTYACRSGYSCCSLGSGCCSTSTYRPTTSESSSSSSNVSTGAIIGIVIGIIGALLAIIRIYLCCVCCHRLQQQPQQQAYTQPPQTELVPTARANTEPPIAVGVVVIDTTPENYRVERRNKWLRTVYLVYGSLLHVPRISYEWTQF